MWLNLYLRDSLGQNIYNSIFPREQSDDAQPETRQCLTFGEAVSVFPGNKKTPSLIAEHFRSFYVGLKQDFTIWFAFEDPNCAFESLFNFDDITFDDDTRVIFETIIKPGLLSATFFGKDQLATYEFYSPSVVAHQLGFGQLPIGLYFSDLIKLREAIPDPVHYCLLRSLIPSSATVDLDTWRFQPFSSSLFNTWWTEWAEHLFCVSPKTYCVKLCSDFAVPLDEVCALKISFLSCL